MLWVHLPQGRKRISCTNVLVQAVQILYNIVIRHISPTQLCQVRQRRGESLRTCYYWFTRGYTRESVNNPTWRERIPRSLHPRGCSSRAGAQTPRERGTDPEGRGESDFFLETEVTGVSAWMSICGSDGRGWWVHMLWNLWARG